MGRKNQNAGQPNRSAQMARHAKHLNANQSHRKEPKGTK